MSPEQIVERVDAAIAKALDAKVADYYLILQMAVLNAEALVAKERDDLATAEDKLANHRRELAGFQTNPTLPLSARTVTMEKVSFKL